MHFTTEEATRLKQYLCDLVASESDIDADPQTLADFMYALLQSDSSRDDLYQRCLEELAVFLEDKTEDIIKRVFAALDNKSYMTDKATISSPPPPPPAAVVAVASTVTATATTTEREAASTKTTSPKATAVPVKEKAQRRYEEEEEEEDDDDDTNFKRRSKANTETTSVQKRSFTEDNTTDTGRYSKQPRQGANDINSQFKQKPFKTMKRCFDYDEKGYCMRGDFCPYQHGDDHLVMDATDGSFIPSVSDTSVTANDNMTNTGAGAGGPMRAKTRGQPGRFDASRNGRGGGRLGGGASNINKKSEPVPYTTRYTPFSTKIVVENIPAEQCNIDAVTEYFKKFGKLVNISVQPNASRAFLQYATHQEAMASYQSAAVIFNNRFVKVFWQKVDEEEERKEYLEQQRLASQPDPEAVKAKAAQLAKEKEERQKKQQEHLKKVLELQRHKQQLVERQIEEHKKLMEKLQHAPPGSKEREEIMSAMTHLLDSIKSNQNATTAPATTAPVSATTSATSSLPISPSLHAGTTVPSLPSSTTTPPAPQVSSPTTSSQSEETSTATLDAKKVEMERLKAKLASLEAAKLAATKPGGYPSHRGGRGGMYAWPTRGGRSFSLDNRKKSVQGATATTTNTATESQEENKGNKEEANSNNGNVNEETQEISEVVDPSVEPERL